MSASSAPAWHSLRASHDPTARYSSNPRSDLLSLLDHEVSRVLEFGCGSGATGRLLKMQYPQAHVIGVERDPQTAEAARQSLDEVIAGDLDGLDFASLGWEKGAIDLVIAGDVLEHLFDPWHLLERLQPYLADHCEVLVSVPNIANAWIIAQLTEGRWEYEAEGLLDVTHVRFFTKATAERLLTETGYRVEAMKRTVDDRVPVWPHGPEVTASDLDINSMVLKAMTPARWEDMRTLQYLLRARPMRRQTLSVVGAAEGQTNPVDQPSEPPADTSEAPAHPVLRVAVLSTEMPEYACSEIRLRSPFRHLGESCELLWAITHLEHGSWTLDRSLLDKADVVVVQRFFPCQESMGLLDQIKASGTPLIYETDDLLTGLPKTNPFHEAVKPQLPFIEKCIRSADAVTVSTEALKEEYAHLNPCIEVLPNYLDETLWQVPSSVRDQVAGPLRILYASTPTHHEDLASILPAMERLKAAHGEAIRFVFMGTPPPAGARLGEVETLAFTPGYRAYAEVLCHTPIDLALAPLVDNPFNRAKSAIKWLEYSALGLPAVYSDLPPYGVVEHGRTGLRVANTVDAWYLAIDTLIRSPALRNSIGSAARAEVLQHWTVAQHAEAHARRYRAVFDAAKLKAVTSEMEPTALQAVNQDRLWACREFEGNVAAIEVLIRGNVDDGGALRKTGDALGEQWVQPSKVRALPGLSFADINSTASACASEWLLFLRTGDVCDPALLATLMRSVGEHPAWGAVYFDEAQIGEDGQLLNQHFKPEFNLDLLRSIPYTGTALAVRRTLFEELGGFDARCEGIEEHDFLLRSYERLGPSGIGHLSGLLIFHKPSVVLSQRPLSEVLEAGRQALAGHLGRLGVAAEVEHGRLPATFRVRYAQAEKPLVSMIIPTRNQRELLDRCVQSLFAHTAWPKFEILVVDNGSDEPDAIEFLEGLRALGTELEGRIRVLDYPHSFNYSAMNNLAAREAQGEYLLLLNNDTQALHPEWLDAMMAHAQRPEVGVVGAKLLYPDSTVQHAGVILGMKGPAEHPFLGREAKDPGYFGRLQVDQNYSAVTGACLLVRRSLFEAVGGLDEDELAVSYSDIDLCLKVREHGHLVVWTPHAILMHEGSKSQKTDVEKLENKAKAERFAREQAVMYRRWLPRMANDPAYNRNLSLGSTEFLFEPEEALRWDPEWRPAPRIVSHPADRMGCGEYRIVAPTRALINAGRIQGVESERIYTPPELARIQPDALVLQRQLEPHQIEAIERHKRFNDVFCVFEIDDLVTNVPVKNAHKKHLPKDVFKRLRRAVSFCDRLVVATEPLAEAYRGLCEDVRVIPNFIEDARWGGFQPARRTSRKPRVGWAGGISHTGDLELVEGVVEALKDEVEWVFFGMCPERLRHYVHEFHEPVAIDQYASRLASLNLDLAIAPLEDVAFNRAKSHLRVLEYGILGYPVVCSDLTPYQGDFPVTRVRNRFREWVDAIREHLSDLDATAAQGDALRSHVRDHWLLERNLDMWLQGWLPPSAERG